MRGTKSNLGRVNSILLPKRGKLAQSVVAFQARVHGPPTCLTLDESQSQFLTRVRRNRVQLAPHIHREEEGKRYLYGGASSDTHSDGNKQQNKTKKPPNKNLILNLMQNVVHNILRPCFPSTICVEREKENSTRLPQPYGRELSKYETIFGRRCVSHFAVVTMSASGPEASDVVQRPFYVVSPHLPKSS